MENIEQSQTPASEAQPQEYTPVTMTKKAADIYGVRLEG